MPPVRALPRTFAAALAAAAALVASAQPCPPALAARPAAAAADPVLADDRAGAALAPAWERRAPPGKALRFDGVVDGAGHVYWIEARPDGGGAELVSARHDGRLRYSAPTRVAGPLALAAPVVFGASPSPGCRGLGAPALEAHRASDGARAWRRELLAALEPWMRAPGRCRYGSVHAVAARGAELVASVSILDADTKEHESGFVGLSAATGEISWALRTSRAENVARSGAPRVAEDGVAYASRAETSAREPLLVLAAGAPPRELPAPELHGEVLAASGPLVLDEGRSVADPTVGAAATVEARCRATGALLGTFPGPAVALVAPGSAWLFGDELSRHDLATGALAWHVRLGAPAGPPARGRVPLLLRTEPLVTADGAILFAEQRASLSPALARLDAGPALLREIDAAGRETLRRTLPSGPDVYDGAAALDRGRWFVAARPYHAATGGVLRAFDVGRREAAPRGWIGRRGSPARDDRARSGAAAER